jgi:hypothetical protein
MMHPMYHAATKYSHHNRNRLDPTLAVTTIATGWQTLNTATPAQYSMTQMYLRILILP